MLQPVDVFTHRRRSLRRAVDLECSVVCDAWDEPVPHRVRDLSPDGAFLESQLLLERGTELVAEVSFRKAEPFCLFGRVRRTEIRRRTGERTLTGMGVEWLDMDIALRDAIHVATAGHPPPLPLCPPLPRREFVWVESLLTWEEDLGDRVNVWEVSELVAADLDSLRIEDASSLAAPLFSRLQSAK